MITWAFVFGAIQLGANEMALIWVMFTGVLDICLAYLIMDKIADIVKNWKQQTDNGCGLISCGCNNLITNKTKLKK